VAQAFSRHEKKENKKKKEEEAIETISNLLKLMLRGMLPWLHE
jgi:hypothetical protein